MTTISYIEQCMLAKGIILPEPNSPTANYVPFVATGPHVYIAGQGPRLHGALQFTGKVGIDCTLEEGQEAARICMLNIVSHLKVACGGNLDRVRQAVRVAGLVNCGPDFTQHPAVLDGASNVLREIFGEKGLHVRIATGASSLPFDMAVEVEAVFEVS